MATLTVKSKETIQHLLQECYAEIDSLKLTNQSDVINKLEGNLKQIEGLVTNMPATNADEYRLNDLSAYLGLEAKRLLGDDPTNARTSRRVRIQGFSKRPPLKPILDHITKMNIPRGQIYDTRQSRDVDHGFGPHTIVIDFMRWENAFDFAQSQQGQSFPFHWFSDDKVETVYVEHHQNTISTQEIVKLEASNTTRILVVWKRRNSFPEKFIHELFEEDKVRKPNDIPEPNLRQPAVGLEAKHLEYLQHFGFTITLNTETIEIKISDLAQLVELTTRTIMDGYIRHTITPQVPCYFTQDRVAQYRSVGDVQTVRVQTQRVWMHVKAVGQTVLKTWQEDFDDLGIEDMNMGVVNDRKRQCARDMERNKSG